MKRISLVNRLWAALPLAFVYGLSLSLIPTVPLAAKMPASGEGIFKQSCQSCHPGGSNIVNASKPICGSSKLSTLAIFKAYLQAPVGHMPYYKHIIADKPALEALYKYCKTLKKGALEQALHNGLSGKDARG